MSGVAEARVTQAGTLSDRASGSWHLRCHRSTVTPHGLGTVLEPASPGAAVCHLSVESNWYLPSWALLFCCARITAFLGTSKSRWRHRVGGWQDCAVGARGSGDTSASWRLLLSEPLPVAPWVAWQSYRATDVGTGLWLVKVGSGQRPAINVCPGRGFKCMV